MVNKVILVDPVYPGLGAPSNSESIVRYKMAISPGDVVNGQLTDLKYPSQFPHWGDQYKVQMQYKGFRNALISTRFHYAAPGQVKSNYKELDSLHKPVLLIWGKEDKTVPFKYSDSLREILHTEYWPIDDAAHLPQMEKASLVNEKIISFLKGSE
jgi:pimeloyl-ACP methyl ester carboxylesterase